MVQISLGLDSPVSGDKNASFLLVQRGHMGILSPAFGKKKEGKSALLASAVFQVSLA